MTTEKINRGMLTCHNNNIAGESDTQSPAKIELLSEMNKNANQCNFMKKNADSILQSQTVDNIIIENYLFISRIMHI